MDLRQISRTLPTQRAQSLWTEFRNFAFKGNVIDLAVGVIIGAAFGKVVDALVKKVLMPVINLFVPGQETYTAWKLVLRGKEIPYGEFLGELVNFLIVAAAVWLFLVKFLGWVMRAKTADEAAAPPPPLTKDQQLLTEIRDLLRASGPATSGAE